MSSLEQDFHREMVAMYEAQKAYGYNAAYFKQMLDEQGGVEAARRLLAAPKPQEGLYTLWDLDRLGDSVEAYVLRIEYEAPFNEAERAEARRRLDELGYFKVPRGE